MVKILDCTTRDGGHETKWNFEDVFVNTLMEFLNNKKVVFAPSLNPTPGLLRIEQTDGLRFENVENGMNGNDECIEKLLLYYNKRITRRIEDEEKSKEYY